MIHSKVSTVRVMTGLHKLLSKLPLKKTKVLFLFIFVVLGTATVTLVITNNRFLVRSSADASLQVDNVMKRAFRYKNIPDTRFVEAHRPSLNDSGFLVDDHPLLDNNDEFSTPSSSNTASLPKNAELGKNEETWRTSEILSTSVQTTEQQIMHNNLRETKLGEQAHIKSAEDSRSQHFTDMEKFFRKSNQDHKRISLGNKDNRFPKNVNFSPRGKWVPLDKNNPKMFVYAAYYDDVDRVPFVRLLLSIYMKTIHFEVVCLYFDLQKSVLRYVGRSRGVGASFLFEKLRYNKAYVKCPLPASYQRPYAISVIKYVINRKDDVTSYTNYVTTIHRLQYGDNDVSENRFRASSFKFIPSGIKAPQKTTEKVQPRENDVDNSLNDKSWKLRWNITQCYPCFHDYRDVMQLIQQVETSRMFGVEHFVFYVHSVSHSVLAALEYYKQTGVAEVQDWRYPPQMGDGVYFHQKTAVHDCLYRHTRTSRYLLFGDVDEIFVPRSTGHLLPLLTSQFSQKPECGSLQFLNTFYDTNPHSNYDVSTLPDIGFIRHYNMTVLLRQERLKEIWPPRLRSKLAVIPSRIELLQVHYTNKFRGDYQECPLPSHLGLLQHYRTGLPGPLKKVHRPKAVGFIPDPHLANFAASIVRRVRTVLDDLGALGPDFNV